MDPNIFTYKGRTIVAIPTAAGGWVITYEGSDQEVSRIKQKYGNEYVYADRYIYLAQFDKGKNTLTTTGGPITDQSVLGGITNEQLVAAMYADQNFYQQATRTNSPNSSEVDPNQPGTPGGSTPTNPNEGIDVIDLRRFSQYMVYPADMRNDQDRIKFTAVEYEATGVTAQANAGSTNLPGTPGIRNPNRTDISKKSIIGSVFLPVQASITDSNSVDWQGGTLNEIERELANLSLGAMTSSSSNFTEYVQGQVGAMVGKVAQAAPEIRVALAGAAVGIQNILGRFGTVLNPNLELLFTGPQLRPFTFTFKMSPRNKEESRRVKEIIKFFKKNMAPKGKGGDIFLRAPNTFFIEYQKGTELHPSINKIKECALVNCSVDYTPLGTYMTYNDDEGTMVSYSLTLSFQELEPVYDKDYDGHAIGY